MDSYTLSLPYQLLSLLLVALLLFDSPGSPSPYRSVTHVSVYAFVCRFQRSLTCFVSSKSDKGINVLHYHYTW